VSQFVVSVTRIPTNYNPTTSYVVEAATEADAQVIVKHEIRDLSDRWSFVYAVKPYTPPPAGRIIGLLP